MGKHNGKTNNEMLYMSTVTRYWDSTMEEDRRKGDVRIDISVISKNEFEKMKDDYVVDTSIKDDECYVHFDDDGGSDWHQSTATAVVSDLQSCLRKTDEFCRQVHARFLLTSSIPKNITLSDSMDKDTFAKEFRECSKTAWDEWKKTQDEEMKKYHAEQRLKMKKYGVKYTFYAVFSPTPSDGPNSYGLAERSISQSPINPDGTLTYVLEPIVHPETNKEYCVKTTEDLGDEVVDVMSSDLKTCLLVGDDIMQKHNLKFLSSDKDAMIETFTFDTLLSGKIDEKELSDAFDACRKIVLERDGKSVDEQKTADQASLADTELGVNDLTSSDDKTDEMQGDND